jgi:hypothetical protein
LWELIYFIITYLKGNGGEEGTEEDVDDKNSIGEGDCWPGQRHKGVQEH